MYFYLVSTLYIIDPYYNGLEKSRDNDDDDIPDEVLEKPTFVLERKSNEVAEIQNQISIPVNTTVEMLQRSSLSVTSPSTSM